MADRVHRRAGERVVGAARRRRDAGAGSCRSRLSGSCGDARCCRRRRCRRRASRRGRRRSARRCGSTLRSRPVRIGSRRLAEAEADDPVVLARGEVGVDEAVALVVGRHREPEQAALARGGVDARRRSSTSRGSPPPAGTRRMRPVVRSLTSASPPGRKATPHGTSSPVATTRTARRPRRPSTRSSPAPGTTAQPPSSPQPASASAHEECATGRVRASAERHTQGPPSEEPHDRVSSEQSWRSTRQCRSRCPRWASR